MAKTQVPGSYIKDDAITTAKIADNTIQAAHLHSSHGITTNNIGEHANNKYYTDARVDTRLAATKSSNFVTTGNIQVNSDSNYIKLGSGDDLFIKHNGTDSYIENYTGHLYIKNFADDKDIHFQSDDGSGGTTSYMYLDGSETSVRFAQNLRIDDGIRARFGASNDLQIYHSGTDSFIDESGTGKLFIRSNEIRLNKYSGEFMIRAIADGAVTLYHDNSAKIATTSTGVSVTGGVNTTGTVTADTHFTSSDTNATLSATGTGNVYLRPNGYSTTTGQVHIATSGDATFSNNVIVTGNLTVNGSQTVLNTATLDVEDKNITLNKGSGDTSSTADGAGITIQDAVDASNDATLLWNAAGDKFVTSHALDVTGQLTTNDRLKIIGPSGGSGILYIFDSDNGVAVTDGLLLQKSGNQGYIYNRESAGSLNLGAGNTNNYLTITSAGVLQAGGTSWFDQNRNITNIPSIEITNAASNSYGFIEMLGTSGAYIDLKNSSSDDYDMRLISFGTGGEIVSGSGDIVIKRQGATKLSTSAAGITVTGAITASADISVVESSDAKIIVNSVGDYFPSLEIKRTSGSSKTNYAWNFQIGSSGFLNLVDGTNSYYAAIFKNNGDIALSNDTDSTNPVLLLDKSASSATFAGTISSGAITSSAVQTFTKSVYGDFSTENFFRIKLQNQGGITNDVGIGQHASGSMGFNVTQGGEFRFNEGTDGIVGVIGANGVDARQGGFRIGTTTVIDSSRNLTNIGTISSGAITASATSTIQGNLLLDVDNAEINLKSGVGTTSGAVNWTFNSTGTDYASIKLPYATRASKGLWIDSGYPITIDATTRIDFDIAGSTKMDLDNSGLGVTGTVVASGNVQHTGLTMTSGTDIDQLITATDSLTLSDAWQDTSIAGSDLATGTYIVQVYANDYAVGGQHYNEYYSGTMSWYGSNTNSTGVDEIILHRAGHAANNGDIYLRTQRHNSGTLMLQIRGGLSNTGASNYIFKFRRMI